MYRTHDNQTNKESTVSIFFLSLSKQDEDGTWMGNFCWSIFSKILEDIISVIQDLQMSSWSFCFRLLIFLLNLLFHKVFWRLTSSLSPLEPPKRTPVPILIHHKFSLSCPYLDTCYEPIVTIV